LGGWAAVTAAKRRGSMRALGAELMPIIRPVLGKRGIGEAQLIQEWDAIVGADLAAEARPDRLTFPAGERREGTLRLKVAPAVALELQHREPLIIERINAFFGYRAVARLAFIQGAPARRRPPAPSRRPLSPEEAERVARRTDAVTDPDLKEALARLGRAIIETQ
jgi:hypothetical protein